MTDKKDEIQAHMIAAIEKSHSIEQMQIRLESLTDTEANLTGFGKDRKLPNPLPNYNIAQDIKDLKNPCLKLLPNAMVKAIELQDPTIFQRALEDAMLIALATKKTREEYDWKPHAIRAAEKIEREHRTKSQSKLGVVMLSQQVAAALERQGIRGRGGKVLTPETIKRELLRTKGFKDS